MFERFRKEYEQAEMKGGEAREDDSRVALRASTYALRRVLDELRRGDRGPSAGV
jgi:hypothetical protein